MVPDIRAEIGRYKARLRSGERGPLAGPRQTGRTTAMLEYAHELSHQRKHVVFVTLNAMMVWAMTKDYRELTEGCLTCTIVRLRENQFFFPKFIGNDPERIEHAQRGYMDVVTLYDTN